MTDTYECARCGTVWDGDIENMNLEELYVDIEYIGDFAGSYTCSVCHDILLSESLEYED